ncbi:MAG: LacI family DNA-binding transcriptional regulator [Lapillicoccus sp.]
MATSRPRLDDVAQRSGVSPATASLVLRERPGPSAETRRRVLDAATALGYRADRSASLLARRRTHLLGVTMDVSNPFHAELLEDIHVAAAERGYDVVVGPLTRVRDERQTALGLVDQRCETLVLLGTGIPRLDLVQLAESTPLVVVGRQVRGPGISVVRAADDHGVAAAVEHLADLGHRRIAFVDGLPGPIATLRREGFRRAMRRYAGDDDPSVVPGGYTEQAGILAPLASISPSPTAVLAFNDRCALGVMDQLRAAGLEVPRDVSVVGFDDSPVARLRTISLTTVSQEPATMAVAAVEAAVRAAVSGRAEEAAHLCREVVLEPRLVVRATTGPPPQSSVSG